MEINRRRNYQARDDYDARVLSLSFVKQLEKIGVPVETGNGNAGKQCRLYLSIKLNG